MTADAITKWIAGNVGLSIVAAFFLMGVLVNFVQTTFYAWYAMSLAIALVIATATGGTLYFYAFLLGVVTAFAEIIGKFRDEPMKSLQTPQAVLYHVLNGAISAFALKIYFLTFGEATTQVDQIKAVMTAGFGAMLLMRSKFFNAKVGDQDISFGPEQIIKVFLSFMERAIDRVRAQSRVDFVRDKFAHLDFAVVRPYCETMLNAAQVLDDRPDLVEALDKLAASSDLDAQLKSYRLGFLLLDRMGEDFVTKLLENKSADWFIQAPVVEKKSDGLFARLQSLGAKDDGRSFYFAYGSSMSTDRFRERLGWSKLDARKFVDSTDPQTCVVHGYRLVFNKPDAQGRNATSNLVPSPDDSVEGVLYRLTDLQLDFLDRSEAGYRRQTITAKAGDKTVQAQAYVAVSTDDSLKPTKAYLQLVVEGAREHQLSASYIERLEQTQTDFTGQVVSAFERRVEEVAAKR
jgi:hypothetical protein